MIQKFYHVIILSLLFCAWALGESTQPSAPIELNLTMGIQRVLTLPFAIGKVTMDDRALLRFRRMASEAGNTQLMFLPDFPGNSNMTIADSRGNHRLRYALHVRGGGISRAIEEQKASERAEGIEVSDLELPMGSKHILSLSFTLGSIWLSDPGMVEYRRVELKNGKTTALLLLPKSAGLTNIMLQDASGRTRRELYIQVTKPAELAGGERTRGSKYSRFLTGGKN